MHKLLYERIFSFPFPSSLKCQNLEPNFKLILRKIDSVTLKVSESVYCFHYNTSLTKVEKIIILKFYSKEIQHKSNFTCAVFLGQNEGEKRLAWVDSYEPKETGQGVISAPPICTTRENQKYVENTLLSPISSVRQDYFEPVVCDIIEVITKNLQGPFAWEIQRALTVAWNIFHFRSHQAKYYQELRLLPFH